MSSNQPAWLKAMQNGSIGEARAKAFLLNRFWVLERSVDIDGADFIIQRRLSGKTLIDSQPPRLGVIQVKFFGTNDTTHYVHTEYVVNDKNEPRAEFFLLCHYGSENNQSTFLLTSREISENFSKSNIDGAEKFRISYKAISNGKFTVTNESRSLDRIERALAHADFRSNRMFLAWALPSVRSDLNGIDPIYQEPISNWYGNLPEVFTDIKKIASEALLDVEEVHELLTKLSIETDPIQAMKTIEEIAYNCKSYHGWSIPLPDRLDDEEFFEACIRHKKIVETLKSHGLLDSYIDLKKKISSTFFDEIKNSIPIGKNRVCVVRCDYDLSTLNMKDLKVDIVNASNYFNVSSDLNEFSMVDIGSHDYSKIVKITETEIIFYFMLGRYGGFKSTTTEELYKEYLETDFSIFKECMDQIYELKFEGTINEI